MNNVASRFTQERLEGTTLDKIWVVVFLGVSLYLGGDLVRHALTHPIALGVSFVGGWLLSDLVSGMVHWAGDTWGTADFPLLGQKLIRPFREHHFDPQSITRHDFFDVNGTNCAITLPLLAGALFVDLGQASTLAFLGVGTIWSLTFWTFLTNQFHKWAHMDEVPPLVGFLQSHWIILPPREHAKHHVSPFSKHYCITTGWLNPGLLAIGFFRRLEGAITWLTGVPPRLEEHHISVEMHAEASAVRPIPVALERPSRDESLGHRG